MVRLVPTPGERGGGGGGRAGPVLCPGGSESFGGRRDVTKEVVPGLSKPDECKSKGGFMFSTVEQSVNKHIKNISDQKSAGRFGKCCAYF